MLVGAFVAKMLCKLCLDVQMLLLFIKLGPSEAKMHRDTQ